MRIVNNILELKQILKAENKKDKSIGFVPTMGFLHRGHISLIEKASKENDVVVVSIFVNPTQFGPNEDFDKYPRNEERDAMLCDEAGCDYIFMPSSEEMYNAGANTFVEVLGLADGLCGKSRPIHFRGVCTVVMKLFNIVKPDRAYFGQKDAQQLAIIKKMVRDLDMDVLVIGCPIVREQDGLALSSRNTYLSKDEREQALVLNKALNYAGSLIEKGERSSKIIIKKMKEMIETSPLANIDYIEIVAADTLKAIDTLEQEILIALAVKFGKTRLIDNRSVTI